MIKPLRILKCSVDRNSDLIDYATLTDEVAGLAYHIANKRYCVVQDADGFSTIKEWDRIPSLFEFLGAMTFSSWQEVRYEQLLLVEGSSDVPLMQHLLGLYGKADKVLVWSLGGNDMIHNRNPAVLAELKRLDCKVSAIIDSEKTNGHQQIDANRQSFATACNEAGICCHVTNRRATENYLTESALASYFKKPTPRLGDFDALKLHPARWSKRDNWRIARHMSRKDWDATDIGQFVASL